MVCSDSLRLFLGTVKKGNGLSYVVHDTSKSMSKKIDKQLTKYANAAKSNPEVTNVARKCVVSFTKLLNQFS